MSGIILAMVGWGLGGFFNGIAGFGAALVAMPILACGIDMAIAVPCAGLMVLALNVQMAWSYRRHLVTTGIRPLLVGALPGALAGALLLRFVSESGLRLGLGLLLLCYGLWGLYSRRLHRRDVHAVWGMLAGFFSTSFGTAYGINAPPWRCTCPCEEAPKARPRRRWASSSLSAGCSSSRPRPWPACIPSRRSFSSPRRFPLCCLAAGQAYDFRPGSTT